MAAEFAARVVQAFQSRANEGFSLVLSGGETARACYQRLADQAVSGDDQLDWWKVDLYWGDERCVPLDDPDSNYRLARETLLERVGAANATYPMRCDEGPDPYQLRVGELGHFDLVHLGLGPDGHTAVAVPRLGRPRRRSRAGWWCMNDDPLATNPHRRMTLTFAGIARARLVLVTVAGESKREALARVVAGDDVPAARIAAEQVRLAGRPRRGRRLRRCLSRVDRPIGFAR